MQNRYTPSQFLCSYLPETALYFFIKFQCLDFNGWAFHNSRNVNPLGFESLEDLRPRIFAHYFVVIPKHLKVSLQAVSGRAQYHTVFYQDFLLKEISSVIQDNVIRLIVIEESANDAEVILNSLRKARYPIRPKHVEDEEDLQEALSGQEWDLVIAVPAVGELTATTVCEMVKASNQDIPIIILCQKFTAESVGELMEAGVRHVIPNGSDIALQHAVKKELSDLATRQNLRHIEQMYRQSQQHNKMLLSTSRDAISYVHDGMHIHANPAYMDMFGYETMEELEGMPVMDLVAPEDHVKFKDFMREYMTDDNEEDRDMELIGLRLQKNKRHKFRLKMEVSQAIYENEKCIQIVIRDQTDSKELEKKLKEKYAKLDQLTELYNRPHFIQLVEKAIAKTMETHIRSVVLYVTLDNFSAIRDRVGVGNSDPVIKQTAKVLKQYADEVTLARFAEYTFTFLLHDTDVAKAQTFAEKIRKVVETCVTELEEQSVVTTCSIGIAQVLASAGTPQSVLNDAHTACKAAMKEGGNHIEVYKATVRSGSTGDAALQDVAKMIETAIEENRFHLVYQPIVSLRGEEEEIYEVFLRMVDAEAKPVPPGTLFAAAEKANLSIHLDQWVLKESSRILKEREKSKFNTHFFIKLSDQAVKDESLLLYINKLLKTAQLSGDHLTIEISEATAISQIKHAKVFATQLKRMGCRSAIEHFGTGLNSETLLKHLPVDYVKIDSSYAKGLSSSTEHQNAVNHIVELAHRYEKMTIAEAVEDANSLAVLFQCEVDFAQGHYIQEPIDSMDYDFSE